MRAPLVAILDGQFTYFCSAECRKASPALSITPPPVAAVAKVRAVAGDAEGASERERARGREHVLERERAIEREVERERAIERAHEAARERERAHEAARERGREHEAARDRETQRENERTQELERERGIARERERARERDVDRDEPIPPSRASIPQAPPPTKIVYEDLGVEAAPPSIAPPSFIRRAQETARTSDREGQILRVLALAVALLAVGLGLVDAGAGVLRIAIASGGAGLLAAVALLARARLSGAKPLERAVQQNLGAPHEAAIVAAAGSVAFAFALRGLHRPGATTAENAAIWIVLAAAVAETVSHASARRTLDGARAVLASLEPDAETRRTDALAKLGDVVELQTGALVSSDVRLISGSLTCDLWGNTALRSRRVEGDPVPAGAVVRSGHARARVSAVGRDRAFARLLTDALERVGRASPRLRALDRIAPIVAVGVLFLAVVVGVFGSGAQLMSTIVAGVSAGLSVLIPPARRLAVRDQLAGIIEACRAGVAFRDSEAFVRAGAVRTAVFCLRGTLVSAVPDTCDIEPLAGAEPGDVLALAAGAEIGLQHPIASAIQRMAQARSIRPVDVRNVVHEPGFGVRGELASGASVIVGSRALALRWHVPTAEHEARMLELEATGRDVVLVSRDGRTVGLIALQYPLRSGALASVQRLHDVEVDPVIMGGATRGRLEAIGKAVDIEHVRPEIAARDRGAEVKRIAQSGGPIAVIGRPSLDGPALAAADVAIALGEAGAAPDAPAVSLAHDHLVPAVDVLALAQATRARVSATIAVGLAPVVLAALPVAFALIRPTYAPLAALAATIALGVRDLVAAALPEGGRMEDN